MKQLLLIITVSIAILVAQPLLAMEKTNMNALHYQHYTFAPTWQFLNAGDTIEIIAPSAAPLTPEQIGKVKEFITQQGVGASFPEGMFNQKASRNQYYAHSDEGRAQYLVSALQGDAKVLWAILGGFGAAEVVAILERDAFAPPLNPKLIIGFSDITALHLLAASWGWPSLHGPVAGLGKELFTETNADENNETTLSSIFKILKGEITQLEYTFEVIYSGISSVKTPIIGSVMGGNLSIIENHSGTKTALRGKGRFIFFEDTPEEEERLFRRLTNLVRTGVFDEAKGILIGSLPIKNFENSLQVTKDVINSFVKQCLLPRKINIPVIYSPRFGHGPYNDVMPLGTVATLSVQGEKAILQVSVNESAYK